MSNSTIKQKPPKAKKCLCPCGEMFTPKGMEKWISQSHYARWLTETEKGQEVMAKKIEKAKKQVAKVEKDKEDELKRTIKSWRPSAHEKKYKKSLQDDVNKLSRMIDAKFGYINCIDCDKSMEGYQIDACHLMSRGKNCTLSYHLLNLHSGHNHCNFYNEKHEGNYKQGIINRYGEKTLAKILELPLIYKEIHLSSVEIVEKLKIVRSLVKNFDTFKAENAIEMREMMNNVIGIYGNNE